MKKPTDELFLLIKSMNKGEKIHFRNFVNSGVKEIKTNYIFLYEAIERMNDYDEDRLKKQLKNRVNIRHFAYEKNNLRNLLLKSLVQFRSDKSIESSVRYQINIATILRDEEAIFKVWLECLDQEITAKEFTSFVFFAVTGHFRVFYPRLFQLKL